MKRFGTRRHEALDRKGSPQVSRGAPKRISLQLSKVFGRVAVAILFFAVVTPLALVMRSIGRDPLRRRLDREASSYWLARGTARDDRQTSMTRQF